MDTLAIFIRQDKDGRLALDIEAGQGDEQRESVVSGFYPDASAVLQAIAAQLERLANNPDD